jgi:hypothetical protein
MPNAAQLFQRYRVAILALAVSAVVHAAVLVGTPPRIAAIGDEPGETYTATLDPLAETVVESPAPAPAARPTPRRASKPRARTVIAPEPLMDPVAPSGPLAEAAAPMIEPVMPPEPEPPKPEVVAMAQPATPIPALEAPKFPTQALPASMTIAYSLTSSFADGRAVYSWSRDGDNYTISSEAEAIGFFTLFLEGRILQESSGTVTAEGLRPQRFVERKPNMPSEGLEFDWNAHKVTFDRNNEKKTEALEENTVDWLSMIFQMAHVPPKGETYDLRVYTQRKLYKFSLKVLGEEEIDIPIGKVRAQHLRHIDPEDGQVVDVWLGVDQHYLPVKLRYPVARNRLTVEQVATRVTSR